jgi:hypothetical protein
MNARSTFPAVLAAALLGSIAAFQSAAATTLPGELALPAATLTLAAPLSTTPEFELTHQPALPAIEEAGVHYRPRRQGWGRAQDAASVSQVHLGFYDPDGDPGRKFLMGLRGGPMIDSRVQLGVGLDWAHQTDNTSSVSHQSIGPGGQVITVKTDLARASTNFFPIMAFAQLSADDDLPVIPYFGVAGGYELMNLSADDFQTGASFDATYGGWGWQIWGGAALPLSGRSRLMGELYVNNAELGRDVTDSTSGNTYRETVNANGLGMRFGLAWGF